MPLERTTRHPVRPARGIRVWFNARNVVAFGWLLEYPDGEQAVLWADRSKPPFAEIVIDDRSPIAYPQVKDLEAARRAPRRSIPVWIMIHAIIATVMAVAVVGVEADPGSGPGPYQVTMAKRNRGRRLPDDPVRFNRW